MNFGWVVALLLYAAPALPQTSTPDAQQPAGIVNGTIDDTGAAISGAKVTLSHDGGFAPAVACRDQGTHGGFQDA